ncbi:MAG TPA: hypothetical protein DCP75_18635 [Haliea salexigens]|uniref:Uncharacterized protein n=1 Tax=Haliea salexigens TaxID=287487 RepID=A0A3C1KSP3_9GAMM|nr:hypothetical protein [Haliea salexigens]
MFSSAEIENFSQRDRIRFYRHFRIQVPTPDQMRSILAAVRELLKSHEQVLDDTASVRFENIVDGNAVLRVDAGVATTDFQTFLEVAEALNLSMLDIVSQAGAHFTGPAQLHQQPLNVQKQKTADSDESTV